MRTNDIMKQHLGNLSRSLGHDITNRYNYILTSGELYKSFTEIHQDLLYPLRKEVKRDRYIYNAEGLQKDIDSLVNNTLSDAMNTMNTEVANDTASAVSDALNSIVVVNNKFVYNNKNRFNSKYWDSVVRNMAKGLVKGVGDIIDDIINDK